MSSPIKFWLVQRIESCPVEDSRGVGVGRYIDLDYMGAAEFEFGAVPRSFRALRKNFTWLENVKLGAATVWVMHAASLNSTDVLEALDSLGSETHRLKEPSYWDLVYRNESRSEYKSKVDAWLAIDTQPILWTTNQVLANKLRAELMLDSPTPEGPRLRVNPDELRLFDTVVFEHEAKDWTGKLVGIYEEHAVVSLSTGNRQSIKYTAIQKVIA